MWEGSRQSHYRDIDNKHTYCGKAYDVLTERLWSVFQDVGRIPLCKKCMTKIRQRNRASDARPKAVKALYRQLAIDTAAELRLSERGDPFDDWRPSK